MKFMMDAQLQHEDVLLDSDISVPIFPMPPPSYLLHPSSDDEMARERELLYDNALSLSLRMTLTHFTSQIAEDELKDAIRFLKSDEQQPAQKLLEKLGRIQRILATITAAVEAHV